MFIVLTNEGAWVFWGTTRLREELMPVGSLRGHTTGTGG